MFQERKEYDSVGGKPATARTLDGIGTNMVEDGIKKRKKARLVSSIGEIRAQYSTVESQFDKMTGKKIVELYLKENRVDK